MITLKFKSFLSTCELIKNINLVTHMSLNFAFYAVLLDLFFTF